MNKKFLVFLGLFILTGCESTSESSDYIWKENSQRLQISQNNANSAPNENQITNFDYSLDSISKTTIDKLSTTSTTKNNLFCSNDGTTYTINITNGSGVTITYVSDNRNCGREDEKLFVNSHDIQNIINSF